MLNARLLLWPTLDQPPQRAGGAVPGCFLLAFLGTFAAIEEELNPATTPRDTLSVYCNTALCVKAQLSHTEAKPPWLLPPRTSSPVGRAQAASCPVLGAAPAAPSPQVGVPPRALSKTQSTAAAQRGWNCCSGSAVSTERRDLGVTRF